MSEKSTMTGHLAAAVTIFIWGTTFISTKVLLVSFTPLEILFFRFLIGYAALWIAAPRLLHTGDRKAELLFAAAGLCGVTLYFLMENFALTLTQAANVSIIISVAPFFTSLFAAAMLGISLLSFQKDTGVQLSPKGDFLALAAAITWAAYSILTKKIGSYGYGTIESTRRTFFYGLLFMVPALFFLPFRIAPARFMLMQNALNILFLGFGASALFFVTWNFAVRALGSVKTSVYIYAVPVITVITSLIFLHEVITWQSVCGIVLTLAGLMISESRFPLKQSSRKPSVDIGMDRP